MVREVPALAAFHAPEPAGSADQIMKKRVHAALGLGFVLLGMLMIVGFSVVLFRQKALVALLGLALGASAALLGALLLTVFAHEATSDDSGLNLAFAFSNERVQWEYVECYKKIGATWGYEIVGTKLNAAIFVILRYRRVIQGQLHPARAYFWVRGLGPAFSPSSEDYETFLDQYISAKNQRLQGNRGLLDSRHD